MAETLNLKPRLWEISVSFISVIAKLGDKLHLLLTTERLDKLTESYVVSNHKIKMALGKELPATDKEGLRKTIKSF